jgi:hypothetical protein
MESVLTHMPMENPYPFLLLHEGDIVSPALKQEFFEQWLRRADEVILAGQVTLGRKMKYMVDYIEFPEVNLNVPREVAREGLEALGEVFDKWRWPGGHLHLPYKDLPGLIICRISLHVPLLLCKHLFPFSRRRV